MTPLSDGPAHEPRPDLPDAGASDGVGSEAPLPPQLSLVEEEPRRYPSTVGGACYLLILGVTVLALVVVGLGHWRGGVHILAGALAAAAALRAVLPRRDTGMLAVRSRWFDIAVLGAVAVALWVLATTIPVQG